MKAWINTISVISIPMTEKMLPLMRCRKPLKAELKHALAQPEPEGPSKAELRQIFDDQSGFINDEQVMWWSDFQHAPAPSSPAGATCKQRLQLHRCPRAPP
jgi:hypothetical protein